MAGKGGHGSRGDTTARGEAATSSGHQERPSVKPASGFPEQHSLALARTTVRHRSQQDDARTDRGTRRGPRTLEAHWTPDHC
eukprot:152089-Alexandrium_andersonii.AAC.1